MCVLIPNRVALCVLDHGTVLKLWKPLCEWPADS